MGIQLKWIHSEQALVEYRIDRAHYVLLPGSPEAQLEKFTHNLAVSQAGVISSETENQAFSFHADRWPSTLVFLGISPFSTNQFPMPAQRGFGLEDTDDIQKLICGLARRLLEFGG